VACDRKSSSRTKMAKPKRLLLNFRKDFPPAYRLKAHVRSQ
jgi:hypothetical protein